MNKLSYFLTLFTFILFFSCKYNQEVTTDLYTFQDNVLTIDKGDGEYQISAITDDIIKVNYSDDRFNGNTVYAPVLETSIRLQLKDEGQKLILSTKNVQVEIRKDPIQLAFFDKNRALKLVEETGFSLDGDTTSFRFRLQDEERIFGTGFRALPIDRRGYKFDHYNQPQYGYGMGHPALNYSVPHLMSSEKYMLLFDNPAKGYFDVGKTQTDVLDFGTLGGNQAYYFINGENYKDLIREYVDLTGHQELPPLWAFGNLQSRFGYKNQAETDSVLKEVLRQDYPVEAVIIDLYWFSKDIQDGLLGNLAWDADNWPDPEGMIRGFAEKGIKTILVTEPFFINTSKHFDYLSENKLLALDEDGNTFIIKDLYFGPGGLIDIFKPEAREWFWQQYKKQKEIGVAGWWGDLGEPEKHPDSMIHVNGPATEVHGLYGHEWIKMLYDNYAKEYPDERFFKLARAGYAGTQRYGIIPWSGDVGRSWSGFRAQLPIIMSMGLSGLGYMHSDAGGFTMAELDTLLYVRWMQFATFTSIFRPHGDISVAPPEPALWPKEIQDLIKPLIELRYRLMPYIYTLAWENYQTGMPLVRPLFLEYENDIRADTIQNQFLFGPHFLVAPILDPGAVKRTVYLPEGEWFDFWTKEKYPGKREITVDVKPDKIPVFVKAGSVIPSVALFYNTEQYKTDNLTLSYYCPDSEGSETSSVYADDGKTKGAYQEGFYDLIKIKSERSAEAVEFKLRKEGMGYIGSPKSRNIGFQVVNCDHSPKFVLVDGEEIGFAWDQGTKLLTFQLSFTEQSTVKIIL